MKPPFFVYKVADTSVGNAKSGKLCGLTAAPFEKKSFMTRPSPRPKADGRLAREWQTVLTMITLYCRHHHHGDGTALCTECQALADYAEVRLSRCRFAANKPTCRRCPVHCYRPDMRQRMQAVMRYAGPRMFLRHPLMSLRHLWRDVF